MSLSEEQGQTEYPGTEPHVDEVPTEPAERTTPAPCLECRVTAVGADGHIYITCSPWTAREGGDTGK